jgi:hypothetical protein
MSLFSRFLKKPVQPDLHYAAKGFTPVIAAQLGGLDADLYAMADGFADALLKAGHTHHQATSARWGGVTAIGQDLGLFNGFLTTYDDVAAESGVATDTKEQKLARYNAASLAMVTMVMAEAPAEYERFLKYIGAAA